jgi:RHS repeat-associated protein
MSADLLTARVGVNRHREDFFALDKIFGVAMVAFRFGFKSILLMSLGRILLLIAIWTASAFSVSAYAAKPPTTTATTTILATPQNSVMIDQLVTLTATINGKSPTGTVTFYVGSTAIGSRTVSLSQATLEISFGTGYRHDVYAVYSGDAVNKGSTSSFISILTDQYPSVAEFALSSVVATVGKPTTLKVNARSFYTYYPGIPTGTITFRDGTATLGTATLIGGSAQFDASFSTAGIHYLAADYSGDDKFRSTSSGASVSVVDIPSVSITSPTNNATFFSPATISLTARVSDSSIKQVDYYNGAELIGSAIGAPFTFNWNDVGTGTFTLTARVIDARGYSTTSSATTFTLKPMAESVYFVYSDQVDAPRVVTDANNNVVWTWDADPYGQDAPNESQNNSGKDFVFNLRFPGQYADKETGLHYNYYRNYDPQTGRYIESDPIGLHGGVSTFAYAGNSPLEYFDPFGLCQCKGKARVFQGNSNLIGKGGGFNTNPSNIEKYGVTADSAAVIPSQFGLTKVEMRPIVNQISGQLSNGETFGRVRDIMDDKPTRTSLGMTTTQFQQHLIKRESGNGPPVLLLELPGISGDRGILDVTIEMPDGYACPTGTQ